MERVGRFGARAPAGGAVRAGVERQCSPESINGLRDVLLDCMGRDSETTRYLSVCATIKPAKRKHLPPPTWHRVEDLCDELKLFANTESFVERWSFVDHFHVFEVGHKLDWKPSLLAEPVDRNVAGNCEGKRDS